ncbi:MAG: hypothetical protein ACK43M_24160, partial [Allorhizobium sp.]
MLDALRADFAKYPGARITVVAFENGPPIDAPIAIRITGQNLEVLKALAARTEAVLKDTAGARDVSNPMRLDRTDLDLGVDEAKAAALGVPAGAAIYQNTSFDDVDQAFAMQGLLGVAWNLSDNWSMDLTGRYLRTSKLDWGSVTQNVGPAGGSITDVGTFSGRYKDASV